MTQHEFARPGETDIASASWDLGGTPRVSVHVATYRRGDLLGELFAALAGQDLDPADFEVVVVDDASDDGSWAVLSELVRAAAIRVRAIRLEANSGPATARNTAVAASRGEVVVFTDDDCLPDRGWLSALSAAVGSVGDVVQGRVLPPPEERATAAAWDHTIRVGGPSPFFETCNIAYRREHFEEVGGFDTTDPLLNPGHGRHFGEDAVLGARVLEAGASRGFADDAVVYHRFVRRSFVDHLRAQRKVEGFPGLARRSRVFASCLRHGVFLSPRSEAFGLAVACTVAAVATRRAVLAAGAAPWMILALETARHRARHPAAVPAVVAGVGVSDAVTLASLVTGSLRHRRLIL